MKDKEKKVNTEGIGLGLVISKLIIEKFGCKLNFTSQYGKGTTFYYTFPILEITEEELREHNKKLEENTKKQENLQNNWILESSPNVVDINTLENEVPD